MTEAVIYKSESRGKTELDWLTSYHSFSFGDYVDLKRKGWGDLRVINDDFIAPGKGFERHPHWNFEIITYLIDGALDHKDSESNEYTIHSDDVQRISAGSGIEHSEFNHSEVKPVRFLQIWVKASEKGGQPGYAQRSFSKEEKSNQLRLIVSGTGENDSIRVKQDAEIYASILSTNKLIKYKVKREKAWIQIVSGSLMVNELELKSGDGVGFKNPNEIQIEALQGSAEFLLFDIH